MHYVSFRFMGFFHFSMDSVFLGFTDFLPCKEFFLWIKSYD